MSILRYKREIANCLTGECLVLLTYPTKREQSVPIFTPHPHPQRPLNGQVSNVTIPRISILIIAARNLRAEEERMDQEAYEKASQAERLEREARALDEEAAKLEREAKQGGQGGGW